MVTRNPSGAVRDDVTVPQGAAWSRAWNITDAAGNPLTVTGWSVRAQVRYSHSDTVLFEWNTAGGVGIGSAQASGTTVTILLTGSESPAWTWTTAVYDVYLTDPGGVPTRIVEGVFAVSQSITH
uniref:hypothetical protein n=1 Tax=Pseudonocardia sp. CA-138482 TaxID=3240023 RepID=UPI003F493DB7